MGKVSENGSPITNEDHSLKLKYLTTGAVLANLMPLCVVVPGLWALTGIYSLPLILLEHFFNLHNLVIDGEAFPIPQKFGLLIVVPFWAIIGACIGNLTLRIETKKKRAEASLFQIVNRIGGTLLGMILVGYIFLMVITILFYR
jgi:hypothetical protein